MKINEFVDKVKMQDSANVFSTYGGRLDCVPDVMKNFYKKYNPVQVEIGYNGTSICFISADNLARESEYYRNMGVGFVFATCDGDPIFYNAGQVYTCPHGVRNPEWELLAESIEEFFDVIV